MRQETTLAEPPESGQEGCATGWSRQRPEGAASGGNWGPVVWKSRCLTGKEPRDAGSAPGPRAPRSFVAHIRVVGSQSSPRAGGSRIRPFRSALCHRAVWRPSARRPWRPELHLLLRRAQAARWREKWRRGRALSFIQTAEKDNRPRCGIHPAHRSSLPASGSFCSVSPTPHLRISASPPIPSQGSKGRCQQSQCPTCQSRPNCPKVQLRGADSFSPPFYLPSAGNG